MGLGLYLAATPRVSNSLDVVEHHVRARCQELLEGLSRDENRFNVRLHPGAEDVEFTLDGDRLLVSAKTSTLGPGYHAYLCELLHALESDLGARFASGSDDEDDEDDSGDESGYFQSGDRAALEAETFAWLRGLLNIVAENMNDGSSGLMISMSTDTIFEFDDAIATPLGPRSQAWLEAALRDPRAAIDIFPWWSSGTGAEHAAGRALVRMWTEVRWREPVDDEELELLDSIDEDLRRAHELDPTLALPWAEWADILDWLERDDALAERVHQRAQGSTARIGYRRRPVRTNLTGGWSIRIPGEMTTSFDDEGTWCAFVPGRTVWMSSFTIVDRSNPTRSAAETLPTKESGDTPLELPAPAEGYAHRATIGTTGDGDTMVTVQVARPQRLALLTFVLDDADDLDWVREIVGGIRG